MTHNPKELRAGFLPTLLYILRGDRHAHKVNLENVEPIACSTGLLPSIKDGRYETGETSDAFVRSHAMHSGKGEKIYKHFVISLAPNENLDAIQWQEVCEKYMSKLGYNNSHWFACLHKEENKCEHVHILASRVKFEPGGPLVSTHNDYEKGWSVMRHFEKKFKLTQLDNPNDCFGVNYTKQQIKVAGNRTQAMAADPAQKIRTTIKMLYNRHGKPRTIIEFVGMLASKNIYIRPSLTNSGEIKGLSYSLDEETWLSGTRIKKTQLTFQALQRNGVSYQPDRDDYALGLKSHIPNYVQYRVKISDTELKNIKRTKAPFFVRRHKNSAYIDLSISTNKKQRQMAIAIANMKLLIEILLGIDKESVEFKQYLEELALYNYQNNLLHYTDQQYILNSYLKHSEMKIELDNITKRWRNNKTSADLIKTNLIGLEYEYVTK